MCKFQPFLLLLLTLCLVACGDDEHKIALPTIKVGVLHSQHGLFAESEKAIMNATLLAIDQINAQGGVLSRKIEPVLADGQSNPLVFSKEAERLIQKNNVVAIFGGFTSDCRKGMKKIVEREGSILFYPMQYEGLEQSSNIIYMGACPNQGAIPAVSWAFQNFGKRFAILGFNSIYSKVLNITIKDHIHALGGIVTQETYFSRKNPDFNTFIDELKNNLPDVIVTTQGNYLSRLLFDAIEHSEDENIKQIPIFMFGISSMHMSPLMTGKYVIWNYYEQKDSNVNFVEAYKKRFGEHDVIADPMISAYQGVYLWAKAVEQAETPSPDKVIACLPNQSIQGPNGLVYISPDNYHAYRTVCISQVLPNGKHQVVWDSQVPIAPEPFLMFRNNKEWSTLMKELEAEYLVLEEEPSYE